MQMGKSSFQYNHTIVAIEGSITNRPIGGSGSNLGLSVLAGKKKDGDLYNYITQTRDGRTLRTSTTYLRDDDGNVIGALCINYDISDLMVAEEIIKDAAMYPTSKKEVEPEVFANNVGEILDTLTVQCQEYIGKPSSEMTKEDKINAIGFFDSKGAFLISKADVSPVDSMVSSLRGMRGPPFWSSCRLYCRSQAQPKEKSPPVNFRQTLYIENLS